MTDWLLGHSPFPSPDMSTKQVEAKAETERICYLCRETADEDPEHRGPLYACDQCTAGFHMRCQKEFDMTRLNLGDGPVTCPFGHPHHGGLRRRVRKRYRCRRRLNEGGSACRLLLLTAGVAVQGTFFISLISLVIFLLAQFMVDVLAHFLPIYRVNFTWAWVYSVIVFVTVFLFCLLLLTFNALFLTEANVQLDYVM
jgi:hypothetical protein